MTTADLLLHPVRLRIVQAFLGDRALTTSELSVLQSRLANPPAPGRRRRLLGSVLLPADDADPDRHGPTGRSS